ncbi:MAG: SH3 domain-containing protein [Spirochaetes bacterium]|nr:SH3 domain-containing protein [Spirochaetota bacterium]
MKKIALVLCALILPLCGLIADQFLMPSASNLRLRSEPSTKGAIVRNLQAGEKLALIEKGRGETIGGAGGCWVKVRTAAGETGWCFDRYLTEFRAPATLTHSEPEFRIRFSYPASWGRGKVEQWVKDDMSVLVDETYVGFGSGGGYDIRGVGFTRLSSYTDDSKDSIAMIRMVYAERSVAGIPPDRAVELPPVNAAWLAVTAPRYIESADGSFRGVCQFASIGQDVSPSVDCVITLFDGRDSIVTIHVARQSDNPSYTSGKMQGGGAVEAFRRYIAGLTETSNETVTREFNSVYRGIAKSLQKY